MIGAERLAAHGTTKEQTREYVSEEQRPGPSRAGESMRDRLPLFSGIALVQVSPHLYFW